MSHAFGHGDLQQGKRVGDDVFRSGAQCNARLANAVPVSYTHLAPADLCRRQGIAGKGKKYDSGRKKRLTTVFDYDNIYDCLLYTSDVYKRQGLSQTPQF